jgi:hypothetical protein
MVPVNIQLLLKFWNILIKGILWIFFTAKEACNDNSSSDSTLESVIFVASGGSCLLAASLLLFQPISCWYALIALGAYFVAGILSHLSATAWRGSS